MTKLKEYLKVVHVGKHGAVTVKPTHPQHLDFFWLKKYKSK